MLGPGFQSVRERPRVVGAVLDGCAASGASTHSWCEWNVRQVHVGWEEVGWKQV